MPSLADAMPAFSSAVGAAPDDLVDDDDDDELDDTPLRRRLGAATSFAEWIIRSVSPRAVLEMPRRREKFVEITKTVTVTEIINGAPDKHARACEVKVTSGGAHPVNVQIQHQHEKWHSEEAFLGGDAEHATVIRVAEQHDAPRLVAAHDGFRIDDRVAHHVEHKTRPRSADPVATFNRSADNVIDLEFTQPLLVDNQTSESVDGKTKGVGVGGARRRFADLRRKKVSTSTSTTTTETERVRRPRRGRSLPEVQTLYYRHFAENITDERTSAPTSMIWTPNADDSDSGSVVICNDVADTTRDDDADVTPSDQGRKKRLGREESLHFYRDDDVDESQPIGKEYLVKSKHESREEIIQKRHELHVPLESELGVTGVSVNDDHANLTAGITSVSMNNTQTSNSSFNQTTSTTPSTPDVRQIRIDLVGPSDLQNRRRSSSTSRPSIGSDEFDLDIIFVRDGVRRRSRSSAAPPKKRWQIRDVEVTRHHSDDDDFEGPISTSTPLTTLERRVLKEREVVRTTEIIPIRKSSRPPDIKIIGCENISHTKSPVRTPSTPIVVVNQTPSRRGSADILAESSARRRKSTVTDIDWYAAFNMKEPKTPRSPLRSDVAASPDRLEEKRNSNDSRRRSSVPPGITRLPPAEIDLSQVFECSGRSNGDEKERCECNACRFTRLSDTERERLLKEANEKHAIADASSQEETARRLPASHKIQSSQIQMDDVFKERKSSGIDLDEVFDQSNDKENAASTPTSSVAKKIVAIERRLSGQRTTSPSMSMPPPIPAPRPRRRSSLPPSDVSLDEVFGNSNRKPDRPSVSSVLEEPTTNVDVSSPISSKEVTASNSHRDGATNQTQPVDNLPLHDQHDQLSDQTSLSKTLVVSTAADVTTTTTITSTTKQTDVSKPTADVNYVFERGQMPQEGRRTSTISEPGPARKLSVTRKISMDETDSKHKPSRKSSVVLPPSDITLDDIFTALSNKGSRRQSANINVEKTTISSVPEDEGTAAAVSATTSENDWITQVVAEVHHNPSTASLSSDFGIEGSSATTEPKSKPCTTTDKNVDKEPNRKVKPTEEDHQKSPESDLDEVFASGPRDEQSEKSSNGSLKKRVSGYIEPHTTDNSSTAAEKEKKKHEQPETDIDLDHVFENTTSGNRNVEISKDDVRKGKSNTKKRSSVQSTTKEDTSAVGKGDTKPEVNLDETLEKSSRSGSRVEEEKLETPSKEIQKKSEKDSAEVPKEDQPTPNRKKSSEVNLNDVFGSHPSNLDSQTENKNKSTDEQRETPRTESSTSRQHVKQPEQPGVHTRDFHHDGNMDELYGTSSYINFIEESIKKVEQVNEHKKSSKDSKRSKEKRHSTAEGKKEVQHSEIDMGDIFGKSSSSSNRQGKYNTHSESTEKSKKPPTSNSSKVSHSKEKSAPEGSSEVNLDDVFGKSSSSSDRHDNHSEPKERTNEAPTSTPSTASHKQEDSKPKGGSDVNLDDVFGKSSSSSDRHDNPSEPKERTDEAPTSTPSTASHKQEDSKPDGGSEVNLDDVFGKSSSSSDRHDIPSEPKERTDEAPTSTPSTASHKQEDSKPDGGSEVNLDDVFGKSSSSSDRHDIPSEPKERTDEAPTSTPSTASHKQEDSKPDGGSEVNLDDVFGKSSSSSDRHDIPSEPKERTDEAPTSTPSTASHKQETSTPEGSLEVHLDYVFGSHPSNPHSQTEKKNKQRETPRTESSTSRQHVKQAEQPGVHTRDFHHDGNMDELYGTSSYINFIEESIKKVKQENDHTKSSKDSKLSKEKRQSTSEGKKEVQKSEIDMDDVFVKSSSSSDRQDKHDKSGSEERANKASISSTYSHKEELSKHNGSSKVNLDDVFQKDSTSDDQNKTDVKPDAGSSRDAKKSDPNADVNLDKVFGSHPSTSSSQKEQIGPSVPPRRFDRKEEARTQSSKKAEDHYGGQPEGASKAIRKYSDDAKSTSKQAIADDSKQELTLDDFFKASVAQDATKDVDAEVQGIQKRSDEFQASLEDREHAKMFQPHTEIQITEDVKLPSSDVTADAIFYKTEKRLDTVEAKVEKEVEVIKERTSEFDANLEDRQHVVDYRKAVDEEKDKVEDVGLAKTELNLDDVFSAQDDVPNQTEEAVNAEIGDIKASAKQFEKNLKEREQLAAIYQSQPSQEKKTDDVQLSPTVIDVDDVFKQPEAKQEKMTKLKKAKPSKNSDDSKQELTLDEFFAATSEQNEKAAVDVQVQDIRKNAGEFERTVENREQSKMLQPERKSSITEDVQLPPSEVTAETIFALSKEDRPDTEEARVEVEVENIEKRAQEFDGNLEDRQHTVEHRKALEEEAKETADVGLQKSEFNLDDVFNAPKTEDDTEAELDEEVQDIGVNMHQFEHNMEERKQLRALKKAEPEDVQITEDVELPPTEIDIEDVFAGLSAAKPTTAGHDNKKQEPVITSQSSSSSFDEIFPSNEAGERKPMKKDTPPNSDSEPESLTHASLQQIQTNPNKQVTVEINLDDVFGSPPATILSTSSTLGTRFKFNETPPDEATASSIHEEPSRWSEKTTADTQTRLEAETKQTKNSDATSLQHPSPSFASSQVQYEWITDLLNSPTPSSASVGAKSGDQPSLQVHEIDDQPGEPTHMQKDESTWVSSIVYRPSPPETRRTFLVTKSARNSTATSDLDSEVTQADVSWIEKMLSKLSKEEGKESETANQTTYVNSANNSDDERRHEVHEHVASTSTAAEQDDRLLEEVFQSFGDSSASHHGKKCQCSACQLSSLSEEQLHRLRQQWRERQRVKHTEARQASDASDQDLPHVVHSAIPMDDVFNPSQVNIDMSKTTNASVGGIHRDSPCDATSAVVMTTPATTTTTVWKSSTSTSVDKDITTQPSNISLDEIFALSPPSTTSSQQAQQPTTTSLASRRMSSFYADKRPSTPTHRSESINEKPDKTDVVIDKIFHGVFGDEPARNRIVKDRQENVHRENPSYDNYYITTADDASGSVGNNLDVSEFVDDLLGKSLDEASFRSIARKATAATDTSIDRNVSRRAEQPASKQKHEDDVMRLVFAANEDRVREHQDVAMTSMVTLTTSQSFIRPREEEVLEIEVQPEHYLIRGSYSLLIPKSEPLGQLLQKLHDESDSLASLDFTITPRLRKLLLHCLREKALHTHIDDNISWRGRLLLDNPDPATTTFESMNSNKFHPEENVEGIVNFCTAENNICTPLMLDKLKDSSLFVPNPEHLLRYPPVGGYQSTKKALCQYFSNVHHANVPESELALTASSKSGYDVLSYCLFEADDVILTNSPAYAGALTSSEERAQCRMKIVEIDLNNPRLEISAFERVFDEQSKQDNAVRGVVIMNPHNPLGVVFDPQEVIRLCDWASSRNMHVIVDEVFASCVHAPQSSFQSFLAYRHKLARPNYAAYLWSPSKDFGLPGLKFGIVHTPNLILRDAVAKLELYHPCSPFVQDFVVNLLRDLDWVRSFHAEVKRRLRVHFQFVAKHLRSLDLPFVEPQAGVFVFVNFAKYLKSSTPEAELELWRRLAADGVMLTPGQHQRCHEPGWFRIVFACSAAELETGVRRLYKLITGNNSPAIEPIRY